MRAEHRFALATGLGVVIGRLGSIGLAALGARVHEATHGAPALGVGLAVVAGALEGLAIGAAQALALRGAVPARRWTLATMLAFGSAWALAGLLAALEPAGPTDPATFLLYAGGLGLVFGAFVGAIQARAARAALSRAHAFVSYSAAAWSAAFLVLAIAADAAGYATETAEAVASMLGGLLAGLVAGAVQGSALEPLLTRRSPDPDRGSPS